MNANDWEYHERTLAGPRLATWAAGEYSNWEDLAAANLDLSEISRRLAPAMPPRPAQHQMMLCDRHAAKAAKARQVLDAIDAYQPYDYIHGTCWQELAMNWNTRSAPACDHALAALYRVVTAIEEYYK